MGKVDYEKQKEQRKAYNKLQQQLDKTEKEIASLEVTKADLHLKISQEEIFTDFEALHQCQTELQQIEHALEQCHAQWEQIFEAMAALES
jgi:CII-binding regulator of phage lambda lysogenization HflD